VKTTHPAKTIGPGKTIRPAEQGFVEPDSEETGLKEPGLQEPDFEASDPAEPGSPEVGSATPDPALRTRAQAAPTRPQTTDFAIANSGNPPQD
jgi:hypothetical protein